MEGNPIKFFTATINSWKHLLQPDKYKQLVTESMKFLVEDKRVWIYGFVTESINFGSEDLPQAKFSTKFYTFAGKFTDWRYVQGKNADNHN